MIGERLTGIDPAMPAHIDTEIIEPARTHKGGARPFLREILDKHLAENPNKIVTFAELRRELAESGQKISPERTRRLYRSIATTQQVSPIRSRKVGDQKDFDRKVQELRNQGLDKKAIREELRVTMKLVGEAMLRIREEQLRQKEDKVKELRNQGLGNKEISAITGIRLPGVGSILQRLEKRGEEIRLRKKYRTRKR